MVSTANPDLSSSPCWSTVAATNPAFMSCLTPARRTSRTPRVRQALAKYVEIAKILVGRQKDCAGLQASIQYSPVVKAGVFLNDIQNVTDFVSTCAEPVDDFLVDVLVRHDLHAWTCSIGYTTSDPSTSAAKASAARMPSSVRRGCASRIWSTVSPAASFSRISSTVIREPATVGLPLHDFRIGHDSSLRHSSTVYRRFLRSSSLNWLLAIEKISGGDCKVDLRRV